jgi:phosphotransferase system enzyme I (PtsI)
MSMHPGAIPVVKNVIRSSRTDEMAALAREVLQTRTSEEAEKLVLGEMRRRFPEHLLHGSSLSVPEES